MKEGVVGVILRDGKILVIQRAPEVVFAGHWSPPSGRVEPGESQAEAVAREMSEELGLDVEPLEKVWECPTDDGSYRLHWWTVRTRSHELRLAPSEVSAVRWVTPAEFLTLEPGFEGDRRFAREILPGLIR